MDTVKFALGAKLLVPFTMVELVGRIFILSVGFLIHKNKTQNNQSTTVGITLFDFSLHISVTK